MKLSDRLKKVFSNEKFQIIYGIILIVLIPLVIVINTIIIIGRYNRDIDVSLQRTALLIGRVFYSSTRDSLYNVDSLQKKIEEITSASADILELQILFPHPDGFEIVAGVPKESIGNIADFNYYNIAWQQKDYEALAADSSLLTFSRIEKGFGILKGNKRFWLVSMPMRDAEKNKVALLSMKLSSEVVDELTSYNWKASLFSLTLTILITILFLAASTRLWGYVNLYQKIKEVDKMKDDFISIASHELRTPITALKGYISMMMEGSFGPLSQKINEGMQNLSLSAKRLADLVEDLLSVSRIEQGRIQLSLQAVDVVHSLEETVKEMQPLAAEKNLLLKYEASQKSLPFIVVDPDKFKQVLVNVVGNALKYTKQGSVSVSGIYNEDDNFVEIKIQDTGIGISAENQKNIFEKFFRVRSEDTRKIVGTGLGLWITKRIVELMNGKIGIESMEGVGTKVSLSFSVVKNKP